MSSAFALIATLSPKSGAKLLIIFKLTNIFALFFQKKRFFDLAAPIHLIK